MRLLVSEMNGGRVVQARASAPAPGESEWIASYAHVSRLLVDPARLVLHPVVMVPVNGTGASLGQRGLWHRDDQPRAFEALGLEEDAVDRHLVLLPPERLPRTCDVRSAVGMVAIDFAEAVIDLPDAHGFGCDGDAVLSLRVALAGLMVCSALSRGLVSRVDAIHLTAQIRRDFALSLVWRHGEHEFNRTRAAVEASPGLVSRVSSILAHAVASDMDGSPVFRDPDTLYGLACDILDSHVGEDRTTERESAG